jgi:[ribosomal protein S5]-alanine N-acetyltransferase
MIIPTLTTSHICLRPWRIEDAETLLHILQEKDILQYFPPTTPATLEKMERYIRYHLAHWEERGYGHWAVTTREEGKVIGWNGLEFLPETQETEVAYLLSHDFWGKGLATEAAQAAVDFGFQTTGVNAIIGLVHPDNIGSQRVLEKIGLTFTCRATYFGMELNRFLIERPAEKS